MDTTRFTHNGKSWKPSLTTSSCNSFFHSIYGERTHETEAYFDKQAEFRRMRWATFLTYFKNEIMPPCLTDTLRKCMSANDKYEQENIDIKHNLAKYISNIIADQQAITEEDIPILATLENAKVVLFSAGRPDPLRIIEPDSRILGSCSIALERYKEVVLSLERNMFVRLEPIHKNSTPKLDKNKAEKKTNTSKYKKVGCAGSKGVQYQVSLLAVIILNAMKNALNGWKLSTENEEAGKFDDVVFEWSEDTVLIQAKHRDNDKKMISFEELTSLSSKNSDFSLPKYLLSYLSIKEKFNVKNVILCTNANVNEKALQFLNRQDVSRESLLHCEDEDCSFYTLNDEILPVLKEKTILYYDENFKNKDVQKPNITEENLTDFQKQLHIYVNYPPLRILEKVIEKLLSLTKFSSNLHGKITATEIYSKVLDWFHQKEGIYFEEIHAKALFAEIWSDKYCQKLENYKIFLNRNDLNFQDPKQVFHVTSSHGNLLQAIKIYRSMQNYKEKTLFVNPDDDIDTQKLILEAFGLPQYVFVVVIKLKFAEESVITEICGKLRDIIEKKKYKKIILTTRCNDAFFRCIAHRENDYKIVNGSVMFEDLSEASQQSLLKKESVIFQGKSICLKELLAGQTMEGCIRVLDSEILENIIKGKVKVGEQPNWKEIPYFYISRSFKTSAEQKLEDDIYNVKEDMVLISNDAGMGKSTVLSKLAIIIKETNPHLWVIKIALTDYTRFLKDQHDGESISIMDLLNSKKATKLTNNLERFVFSMNKKVVLMLDGVDEISPHYTKLVITLMNHCTKANNFAKLFVTTRPHKVQELQTILKIKPFELQPLTKQNQLDFLTSYWVHNLKVTPENKEKCAQYALELINRMTSWTKGHQNHKNDFIAIALQLRMVAEIFKESIKLNKPSDWEGCKEYLEKTTGNPKLPEKIDLKGLYDMFIEKKRDIYINKGNPNGNPEADITLIKQFNESLTYHKILASNEILPWMASQIFTRHQDHNNITESILKMGIVHSSNEKIYFIHRTFAEYFVAGRLVDELQLQLQCPNIKFQKFFIDEVLNHRNYKVIRVFLDSFLENMIDFIPSNIFKCYQLHMDPYNKNAGFIHLCAEESYIAILQLILKCVNFKIIRNKKICIRYSIVPPREILEAKNTLQLIDQYVQKGGINIMDKHGKTPLYYAVNYNHYEMVKFLIDQGANINLRDYDNNSVLHLAAIKGYLDIAKYLVNQICDINITGRLRRTPLNLAAWYGCLEIVKFLVEAGADLNIVDSKGSTASQSALYRGHSEIVAYFKTLEIKMEMK